MQPQDLSTRRLALDGVRALAVLAVFAHHAQVSHTAGGWIGVEVFFVLSGWLITTLLLQEWAGTGGLALLRFYGRRALRLYPALLLMLVLGIPFYRYLGYSPDAPGYGKATAGAALYVQDFVSAVGAGHGGFAHTWSLAIEEQFYLIWPPLLLLMLRRGSHIVRWLGAAIVASWGVVLFTSDPDPYLPGNYYLPQGQASLLLLGCALAVVMDRGRIPALAFRHAGALALAGLGGLGVMLIVGKASWETNHLGLCLVACGVLSVAVVLGLQEQPDSLVSRLLSVRPLPALGRASYGFYLFHYPVLLVMPHVLPSGQRHLVLTVASFAVTLGLCVASYRLLEQPVLHRWKHHVASPERVPERVAA